MLFKRTILITILAASAGLCSTPAFSAETPSQVKVRKQASERRIASTKHSLLIQPASSRGPILEMIDKAQSTLDLVIYEMDDTDIINAMIKAAKRGVKVRAIFDVRSKHFIPNPNPATMKIMSAGGVSVKEASSALFPITHQKTLVADNSSAIVMSFNLCPGYFGGTRDFGILTTDANEVADIAKTFEADWNGQVYRHPSSPLVWSPDNARQKLLGLINSASATLDIYSLEVKDADTLKALGAAVKRGVKVRLIAAKLMEGDKDVNADGLARVKEAGVAAKSMQALFVHGKMILADYGAQSAAAYVGSQNFSASSLDHNRELGIISVSSAVLKGLRETFDSDWDSIR
ncbi:MAG: phospholipase D-like domain-containing protein [Elusimicrobia bacterium]|nr:phospholipase D-like domain-containing protein [Elusimicrobiota bacterium]